MNELKSALAQKFINSTANDKTLFAMDLTALMVVEQLSKETNQPLEKVLIDFMESNVAKMLYDDSTKLWWDGPSATAEEFKKQSRADGEN